MDSYSFLHALQAQLIPLHLFLTRALPGAVSVVIFWKYMPALDALKTIPELFYLVRFSLFLFLALWATVL